MSVNIANVFNKIKTARRSDEEIYWSLIAKTELTPHEENQLASLVLSLGIDEKHMNEDMAMIEKIRGLRERHAHSERIANEWNHYIAEYDRAEKTFNDAKAALEILVVKKDEAVGYKNHLPQKRHELDNWENQYPFAAKYA